MSNNIMWASTWQVASKNSKTQWNMIQGFFLPLVGTTILLRTVTESGVRIAKTKINNTRDRANSTGWCHSYVSCHFMTHWHVFSASYVCRFIPAALPVMKWSLHCLTPLLTSPDLRWRGLIHICHCFLAGFLSFSCFVSEYFFRVDVAAPPLSIWSVAAAIDNTRSPCPPPPSAVVTSPANHLLHWFIV